MYLVQPRYVVSVFVLNVNCILINFYMQILVSFFDVIILISEGALYFLEFSAHLFTDLTQNHKYFFPTHSETLYISNRSKEQIEKWSAALLRAVVDNYPYIIVCETEYMEIRLIICKLFFCQSLYKPSIPFIHIF